MVLLEEEEFDEEEEELEEEVELAEAEELEVVFEEEGESTEADELFDPVWFVAEEELLEEAPMPAASSNGEGLEGGADHHCKEEFQVCGPSQEVQGVQLLWRGVYSRIWSDLHLITWTSLN